MSSSLPHSDSFFVVEIDKNFPKKSNTFFCFDSIFATMVLENFWQFQKKIERKKRLSRKNNKKRLEKKVQNFMQISCGHMWVQRNPWSQCLYVNHRCKRNGKMENTSTKKWCLKGDEYKEGEPFNLIYDCLGDWGITEISIEVSWLLKTPFSEIELWRRTFEFFWISTRWFENKIFEFSTRTDV